jgi:hypothetical protein
LGLPFLRQPSGCEKVIFLQVEFSSFLTKCPSHLILATFITLKRKHANTIITARWRPVVQKRRNSTYAYILKGTTTQKAITKPVTSYVTGLGKYSCHVFALCSTGRK